MNTLEDAFLNIALNDQLTINNNNNDNNNDNNNNNNNDNNY